MAEETALVVEMATAEGEAQVTAATVVMTIEVGAEATDEVEEADDEPVFVVISLNI